MREQGRIDGVDLPLAYIVRTFGDVTSKTERLHLRVDAEQKALLEAASEAAGTKMSVFVLRAATEAAVEVLADRRAFVLDESAWRAFDDALAGPGREISGLRELLHGPTVLDRREPGDGR